MFVTFSILSQDYPWEITKGLNQIGKIYLFENNILVFDMVSSFSVLLVCCLSDTHFQCNWLKGMAFETFKMAWCTLNLQWFTEILLFMNTWKTLLILWNRKCPFEWQKHIKLSADADSHQKVSSISSLYCISRTKSSTNCGLK